MVSQMSSCSMCLGHAYLESTCWYACLTHCMYADIKKNISRLNMFVQMVTLPLTRMSGTASCPWVHWLPWGLREQLLPLLRRRS
jgi:hypothetical protein